MISDLQQYQGINYVYLDSKVQPFADRLRSKITLYQPDAVHFSFAHPHDVPHDPRHEIARKEDGHLGLHGGNELGEPGSHSRILEQIKEGKVSSTSSFFLSFLFLFCIYYFMYLPCPYVHPFFYSALCYSSFSLSLTHLGVRRCTLGFSGELRQLVLASSVHETAEVGGQEASGEFVLLGIVVVEVWGKKMALVR